MEDFLNNVGERPLCAVFEIAICGMSAFTLTQGGDLDQFLAALDFEYDNDYGGDDTEGSVVWFADGTWADRGEYDGSSWWVHRKVPPMPKELLEAKE
ncbi:MAG: hypothetical protein ACRC62_13085 [Microcoleus sp.]